ncbi:MAG: hypothetical protein HY000_29935 [Planctomycetes bacterium]|nr:hypothetical protein [Planctomycetota bacterium]
MDVEQNRAENQAAFRRLKRNIDASYPGGHFVAIHNGQIIADADSFDALHHVILGQGIDPRQTLVVRSQEEYPETATIFV